MINELPNPVLTQIFRLTAVPGATQDLGEAQAGRRQVVPLVGGSFTGPELEGTLVSGGSVCWLLAMSDGTALTESRLILRCNGGTLLYARSSGVSHSSNPENGERLFRISTRIETADQHLEWLSKGPLITVMGCVGPTLLYETYLVG
jgi:hypothetical protein